MSQEKDTQNSESPKKHRVSFDFSQVAYDKVKAMQSEIGAEKLADLIRESLRLYDWYLGVKRDGGRILKEDKNGDLFELDLESKE